MGLAITGCVLAAIQLIVAADGASSVKAVWGDNFGHDCGACIEVSRFRHRDRPAYFCFNHPRAPQRIVMRPLI